MPKIKVKFSVATCYIGSEYSEIVEIDLDDDLTKEKQQKQIEDLHQEWVSQNIDPGYEIIE